MYIFKSRRRQLRKWSFNMLRFDSNLHKEIGLECYGFLSVLSQIFLDLKVDEISYPDVIWARLICCDEDSLLQNFRILAKKQFIEFKTENAQIIVRHLLLDSKKNATKLSGKGGRGDGNTPSTENLSNNLKEKNVLYKYNTYKKKSLELFEEKEFELTNSKKNNCRFCTRPTCRFGEIEAIYPRDKNSNSKLAHATYRRLKLDRIADKIISDVAERSVHHQPWLIENGKYIHHMKTYFNGKMWNDPICRKAEVHHHERITTQRLSSRTAKILRVHQWTKQSQQPIEREIN